MRKELSIMVASWLISQNSDRLLAAKPDTAPEAQITGFVTVLGVDA
jgi:hypothetical protein